jgi:hypothetical protein
MALLENGTYADCRVYVRACRGVFPDRRRWCLDQTITQSSGTNVGRSGALCVGERKDAPATVQGLVGS